MHFPWYGSFLLDAIPLEMAKWSSFCITSYIKSEETTIGWVEGDETWQLLYFSTTTLSRKGKQEKTGQVAQIRIL